MPMSKLKRKELKMIISTIPIAMDVKAGQTTNVKRQINSTLPFHHPRSHPHWNLSIYLSQNWTKI